MNARSLTPVIALGAVAISLLVVAPAAQTGSPPKCFGKVATIVGTNGDDPNLNGTNGNDVIVGKRGENDINGRGGNDRICGGQDGDDIFGGGGNDRMDSAGGIDFIAGRQGDDLHLGGGGEDQINGAQDSGKGDEDIVRGEEGNDFLDVLDMEDNDKVNGGKGNQDQCLFDAGDDDGQCELF
jgi:Ca2+-binding RTX toxin-like protein